jgi:hypothetical protein
MPTILPFLEGTLFPPDVVTIMGDAYDRARRSMHDTGQPDIVREIIAKRIISMAKEGERDPQKLCEGALKALGVHGNCD